MDMIWMMYNNIWIIQAFSHFSFEHITMSCALEQCKLGEIKREDARGYHV
jgi:hypothetical protein